LNGLLTAGLANGYSNPFNRMGSGIGHRGDGGCVALGFVDRRLFLAFRARNKGFSLACGDVDLFLTSAF
jgi:hypothetical protein